MSVVSEKVIRNIPIFLTLLIVTILFQNACCAVYKKFGEELQEQPKLTSIRESPNKIENNENNNFLSDKIVNEINYGKNKVKKPTLLSKDYKDGKHYFTDSNNKKNILQENTYLTETTSKTVRSQDSRNANKIRRDLSFVWKRSLDSGNENDSQINLKKKHEKKQCKSEHNKCDERVYKKFEIVKDQNKEDMENNTNVVTNVSQEIEHNNKNVHSIKENINRLRRSYSSIYKTMQKNRDDRQKRETFYPGRYPGNATDYYEQRKKVMDKFYARQREIASRYNEQNGISNLDRNYRLTFDSRPNPSVSFEARNPPKFFSQDVTTENYDYNSIRKYQQNYERNPQKSLLTPTEGWKVALGFTPDILTTEPTLDTKKDDFNFYTTPVICPNATAPPPRKTRNKKTFCQNENRGDMEPGTTPPEISNPNNDVQGWGNCTGELVYQHNLFLSLSGNLSSALDTSVQIIMEVPTCITCVLIERSRNTRATISLENGGPNYSSVTLRVIGHENESLSFVVKIWGIKISGSHCPGEGS